MTDTTAPVLQPPFAKRRTGHPYPGFRPFRRDEWPIFFGRDRQVKALLKLLAEHHFICVHGPSGSGKSSLIEAGLIATLERGHRRLGTEWFTGTFRPGAAPVLNLARGLLHALGPNIERTDTSVVEMHSRLVRPGGSIARALRDSGLPRGANLLLVADQFEELFRFRALGDPQEAARFVDLLLDVFDEQPDGIYVAIATRTDFLGDFSDIVGLAEAANAAPYLTPALTEDEFRAAIRGPAELHGGSIDPNLVEALLKDSANEPDRLPILQHALRRCWDVAERGPTPGKLTFEVYRSEAIKSVGEALNCHANEVLGSPELKGLEREVALTFRALTDLDGQRRAIRRPLPWSQLLAETGNSPPRDAKDGGGPLPLERIVNRFRADGTGFLGRPRPEEKELKPDTVVDIAHEALIRRWQNMNRRAAPGTGRPRDGWLWDQVDDGNLYRALLVNARSEDQVISAGELKRRLDWWHRQPRTPAWARRLSDNRDATEQDGKDDLAKIETLFARSSFDRKRQRWLKFLIFFTSLVIFAMLGYFAWDRWDQAVREQKYQAELQWRDEELAKRGEESRLVQAISERDAARRQLAQSQDAVARTQASLDAANERLKGLSATAPVAIGPPLASAAPDQTVQVALKARAEPSPPPTDNAQACEGALWIGSGNAANLDVEGTPRRTATLDDVKPDRRFVLNKNLYLRRGLPRRAGYVQQESIGIVPNGASIVVTGNPVSYDRPSGPQYWVMARTASQVCSLVYLQFTNGSADEALKLAKALEADGYLVPGQEKLGSATGLAEVRFYFSEDKAAAAQLAKDAQSDTRELGLAGNREIKVQDLTGWRGTKPPRGTLELWIDLSKR
jgi:hypothetical protein